MVESSRKDDRRLGLVLLGAIWVFTVPALLGYWIYGLHPERLAGSDLALRFYPISFQLFAQLQIGVAAAVLFVALWRRTRWAWVPAFVTVWLVSFTAEHIGTGYGVPFGGYSYTGLLGPKAGGRVPFLIPVSWFLMAVPAWILARRAFRDSRTRPLRIVMGALWLVAWDLALDPAMSFLTPYWRWEETGPYYGMPWLNLAGWLATGMALMGVLEAFAGRVAWNRLGTGWAAGYFAAVAVMPLGMLAAAGAWPAVLTALAGFGACGLATWLVSAREAAAWRAVGAPDAVEA